MVDHWWQTETGWPITAGFRGLGLFPFKPGAGGRACPGYDVQALDDAGAPLPRGTVGNLALRLPLPPGCAPTLWRNAAGYRAAYLDDFPGWYRTGDAGQVDADGDVWVMGRTDDIINVAGHRLSTGAMEEVLAAHPDVAECAVVGAADALKGQVPLGLVVLKAGADRDAGRGRAGAGGPGARPDRPRGGLQGRPRGGAAAQDAVGQDPARLHPPPGGRGGRGAPADDRRPGDPGRDQGGAGAVGRDAKPRRTYSPCPIALYICARCALIGRFRLAPFGSRPVSHRP